jgi:hypothetical protein
MNTNIESHLIEKRIFKLSKSFAKKRESEASRNTGGCIVESIRHPGEILGPGSAGTSMAKEMEKSASVESTFREMVCRRKTERL